MRLLDCGDTMRIYYVMGISGWFLVKARTKRAARAEGIFEWGRGGVKAVREATHDEVSYYLSLKGAGALSEAI